MVAGLPLGEAKRLNYYFHFRPIPADNDENKKVPCLIWGIVLSVPQRLHDNKFLFFQGITEAIDFLTPIDKDIPKG